MDIDDILASVTRSHAAAHPSTDSSSTQAQHDLQDLTRVWVSERTAPELLPYPTTLIDRVMANIRAQITTIEDATALMTAGTSFTLIVQQTELERFKFLLRSLLRARIAKIDAFPDWYLALHTQQQSSQSQTSQLSGLSAAEAQEGLPLLSPTEHTYLTKHLALLRNHYSAAFLSSFPQKLRRLDDKVGGSSGGGGTGGMIEGPDVDKAVWVRCLGKKRSGGATNGSGRGHEYEMDDDSEDGRVILDNEDRGLRAAGHGKEYAPVSVSCGFTRPRRPGDGEDRNMDEDNRGNQEGGERVVQMRRGEVWVVRWRNIREAVRNGECELL